MTKRNVLGKVTFIIGIIYIISNLHDLAGSIYTGFSQDCFEIFRHSDMPIGDILLFYFKLIGVPVIALAVSIVYLILFKKNDTRIKALTIVALVIHSLQFMYIFFYPIGAVWGNIRSGYKSFILILVLLAVFILQLIPGVPRKVIYMIFAADVIWLAVIRTIGAVDSLRAMATPDAYLGMPVPYYCFLTIIQPLIIALWMVAFFSWMLFPNLFSWCVSGDRSDC